MAIETWSPPQSGFWGGFGAPSSKPPGEGWTITGYNQRRVQNPNPKMGGGYKIVNIPIYTRMTAPPPPPPAPAPAPAPPPPAPTPIQPVNQYQPKITEQEKVVNKQEEQVQAKVAQEVVPPAQDVELQKMLAEQAAAYDKRLAELKIASESQLKEMQQQTASMFESQLGQSQQAASMLETKLGQSQQVIQNMQIQMQAEAQRAMQQRALEAQMLAEQRAKEQAAQQQQMQQMLAQQAMGYQQQTNTLRQQLEQQSAAYRQGLADLGANQKAFQINQVRAAQTPELQIGEQGTIPTIGGTAPFKRRRMDPYTAFGVTPNLNLAQTSTLNI